MDWISVKDDLPSIKESTTQNIYNFSEDVLLTDGHSCRVGFLVKYISSGNTKWNIYDDNSLFLSNDVVAWMPILKFEMQKNH